MAQITYKRLPEEGEAEESGRHPLLANLLRGASGLASGTVSWVPGLGTAGGAAIAGAGESGAEWLEGSPQSPARIATEAAIGAFPMGKAFKVGKIAASALGGGALSGVGEAGREWARGEELNPKSIATSAGIGAATGGGLAGLLGKLGKLGLGSKKVAPPPPVIKTPQEIATETVAARTARFSPKQTSEVSKLEDLFAKGVNRKNIEYPKYLQESFGTALKNKYTGTNALIAKKAEEAAAAAKLAEEAAAARELAALRAEAGLEAVPGQAISRDVISAAGPGGVGKSSVTVPYKTAEQLAEEAAEKLAIKEAKAAVKTKPTSTQSPTEPTTPLGRLFGGAAKGGRKAKTPNKIDEFNTAVEKNLGGLPETPPAPVTPELLPQNLNKLLNTPVEKLTDDELVAIQHLPPVLGGTSARNTAATYELMNRNHPAGKFEHSNTPVFENLNTGEVTQYDLAKGTSADLTPSEVFKSPAALPKAPDLMDEYLNSLPKGPQPIIMGGEVFRPNAIGSTVRDPLSAVAELFRTKTGAAGKAYRLAQEAAQKGEAVPQEGIDILRKGSLDAHAAARAAKLEAEAAGKIEKIVNPDGTVTYRNIAQTAPESTVTPSVLGVTEKGQAQTAKAVAAAAERNKAIRDYRAAMEAKKGGLGSEKGEANPFLLARLALGGTGAAIGAAAGDTPEEKLGYAALGGAIGAGIPSIPGLVSKLQNVGFSAPEAVAHGSLAQQLTTKEGISKLANKIYTDIPEIFRSNLLFSKNIFANAIGGPVSSGYLSAADYAAAGDPRGIKFLKEFNLDSLKDDIIAAVKESATLSHESERAGGTFVGEKLPLWKEVYRTPGRAMTVGDSFIRSRLMKAGFSDKEARTMTLTTEPKWGLNKQIVNITRSGPVGRMLLPFSRTATNIVERGTEALPGIGFLAHKAVGSEVPRAVQAMQQLSGTAVAVAAEQVGENVDPYSPNIKMWRNAISNLGGTKSMQAAAGFAVGQARRMGKIAPLNTARGVKGGTKTALANMFKGMPLPSMSAPTSVINSLLSDTPIEKPPQGLFPTLAVEAYQDVANKLRSSARGGTGTSGSAIRYKRLPD